MPVVFLTKFEKVLNIVYNVHNIQKFDKVLNIVYIVVLQNSFII